MWCVLQGSQRGGGEEVPHWEQDQGRRKARPRPPSPAGPAEGTGTSEGFSQPGSSDLPRPRLPSTSALRGGARPGGRCLSPRPAAPGGAGVARRRPGRRCACLPALCAPADEAAAAGPSRAPRSRRRSPSAGCRRASLAMGRGRRAPARAGAMPWGDARGRCCLIPRQPRLEGEAEREWDRLRLLWHFTPEPASQKEMQSTSSLLWCRYPGQSEQTGMEQKQQAKERGQAFSCLDSGITAFNTTSLLPSRDGTVGKRVPE